MAFIVPGTLLVQGLKEMENTAMLDIIIDVVIDTLKLLPFLYVTYLLMEYLEEKAENRMIDMLQRYEKAGPLIGSALGIVPQCGFSAAAASLFSGGIISAGTLIAIFLSTSDEMLPIMLSETVAPARIIAIVLVKFAFAIVFGMLVDILHRVLVKKPRSKHIHDMCEMEDCHCEEGNIWKSAFIHTLHVLAFIFILSLVFAFMVSAMGEDRLTQLAGQAGILGNIFCGFIGLIPNCAASIMITELYLKGILSTGQMMTGLMVGSGVGLLVLFRTNSNMRENLRLLVILYVCGTLSGLICDFLGFNF